MMWHMSYVPRRQALLKPPRKLESKVEDKTVFLSIIQQVRLPSVQIHVRNGGGNRTAGRQDIQGTDHVTTLARR